MRFKQGVLKIKKIIKVITLCCIAIIVIVGTYLSMQRKVLDFRGMVKKIEIKDNTYTFYIESTISTSYTVIADNKTTIRRCHKNDPKMILSDIKVGDEINGDYKKRFSEENHAKYIIVACK